MKLDAALLLSFCAIVLALSACGGKVVFSDGNGGAGGTGSTTKVTTTTTKSVGTTSTPSSTSSLNSAVSTNVGPTTVNVSSGVTVGPVGSSSTGISTCDTGEIGNPQSNLCNDCVNCAISSTCATEFGTWNSNMDAQAFNACLNQCGNAPGCFNQCKNQHPAGAQVYQALINCLICSGCPANCNSPQQCPP